ncbi:VOC family protein [Sphingobacterium corticibacterium]|uniref:Glyoxalase n=1 Tax=Sphingobacterium corticibacterium TaxID=2484746 RepID=A0A4V2DCS4_9SPHI|nr:glyoxalase [Sphingobacterium corticibacterium]RZF62498.1 glyoxalase [Sphingobacterium corticibacterium]
MTSPRAGRFVSAVFITFSGNCREALTYYQTCFGGSLQFETFEKEELSVTEKPVVIGSLFSEKIILHGSDLVHDEGRILGNYMAAFLHCKTVEERQTLIEKLERGKEYHTIIDDENQKLVEIIDVFEVRWILAV